VANAIFAKVGGFGSEEVILELILNKIVAYHFLLMHWRLVLVHCLKEYCSLWNLQ